jgi:hypothetical protein
MTREFRHLVFALAAVLAVASGAVGQPASDPYQEALRYKFGQARTAVTAIEAQIRAAKPDAL